MEFGTSTVDGWWLIGSGIAAFMAIAIVVLMILNAIRMPSESKCIRAIGISILCVILSGFYATKLYFWVGFVWVEAFCAVLWGCNAMFQIVLFKSTLSLLELAPRAPRIPDIRY